MEPQSTIPMDMRRYGYATPPECGFGGGGVDGGASPATGDTGEDVNVVGPVVGDGILVPTRGRGLGGSL